MNSLNHVAIIMDGNGRWGLKKNQSRNYGHLKGIKAVESVVETSIKIGIPFLTLYTFSTENWNRPHSEINFLFNLIRKSLKKKLGKIIKQGIKINIIGRDKGLPKDILNGFQDKNKLFIPMIKNSRSLNLSNAVSIVLFEAWKQNKFINSEHFNGK